MDLSAAEEALTPALSHKGRGSRPVPPLPLWERGLGGEGLLATLLLVPLLLMVGLQPVFLHTDPDYWWHVRTGQYILATGSVPGVDLYSFTVAGQPWTMHEWLTEVLLYLVQRTWGYVGSIGLYALIGGVTWLAVYAAFRRRGLGEVAAVVLTIWGFGMAMGSVNVRPQGMTALLVAIYALLILRYKQGDTRALWLLPPLMALWVNLHAGYLIGLALLGTAVVGERLARLIHQTAAPLRPLLVVTALSAAATLLTPHPLDALRYPFTYASGGNASLRYVQEWQSPNFHQPYFLIFAASVLLAILLGVGRRPLGPTEALWTVMLALMALQSARHVALYAIVVTPLLGARLQAEAPALQRSLAAWRNRRLLVIAWPLLLLAALSLAALSEKDAHPQLGREPDTATYPVGGVEYLRTHDLAGNLFNEYRWGGYLIYRLWPQQRVFIDGRADPFGDEVMDGYKKVSALLPGWEAVLDKYDVRLALVEKDSPLAGGLSDKGWREVYAGPVEQLFVRNTVVRKSEGR